MQHLRAQELADWLADKEKSAPLLLDVREPWEYEHCHLPGSRLMPMQQVPSGWQLLDEEAEIVVICHHGMRSMQVAHFLERQGLDCVYNLTGGIEAWAVDVDPDMPRY